jgi:hypothetical protein
MLVADCPPLFPFVLVAGSSVRARTHFCLKSVAGHFVQGTAVRVVQEYVLIGESVSVDGKFGDALTVEF